MFARAARYAHMEQTLFNVETIEPSGTTERTVETQHGAVRMDEMSIPRARPSGPLSGVEADGCAVARKSAARRQCLVQCGRMRPAATVATIDTALGTTARQIPIHSKLG